MMQKTIERKQLLKTILGSWNTSAVDVRQIRFEPGQETGRHLHPCHVVGYIAEGTASMQIEGQPKLMLPVGSAFHEPAGEVIAAFNNESQSDPMTFIAFYLLDGEQELIEMLKEK
jgi:quercetin dioxygenase-like cupin family protein